MRKIAVGFLFLLLSHWPSLTVAQNNTLETATEQLKEEEDIFLEFINYISADPGLLVNLAESFAPEVETIRRLVLDDTALSNDEKAKAIRSLGYFIRELIRPISFYGPELYGIPHALQSYRLLLEALLNHRSYQDVVVPLDPVLAQQLANAFWQYDECALLDDIAAYKRVASSPDFILEFLEGVPGFRFADSLLTIAAAHDPAKLMDYLLKEKRGLQTIMLNTKNIYLQEIASLSKEPGVSELLPFIVPLAEKRMTIEEILEKRTNPTGYFQSLVNTLKNEMARDPGPASVFQPLLRNAIREKSISFYIDEINELHSAADPVRFAAVKGLRAEDLYYVITTGEDALYTSSYLGLYLRLRDGLQPSPADSVFRIVQFDNFRVFMRMAAAYNTLADFLTCMPRKTAAELLKRFMTGIETDAGSGLEKAMETADAFAGLGSVTGISDLIENELRSNLDRCRAGQLYLGVRLYSILLQVFELLEKKDTANQLWPGLGNQDVLKNRALRNEKGEIVELVIFFGDKDGVASFHNFLSLFKNKRKWTISKTQYWVTIRSHSRQPLVIYANLPTDIENRLDLQAQDSLSAFLKRQQVAPAILVHRGHSYHLGYTLRALQPSVKLAILGSCGGYNSILSIAHLSPEAQIIVSKKVGSKYINDPLIDVINKNLMDKKDLVWTAVWEQLAIRFSKDPFALNLFNDYIPPTKNVSLFVLKLFDLYK